MSRQDTQLMYHDQHQSCRKTKLVTFIFQEIWLANREVLIAGNRENIRKYIFSLTRRRQQLRMNNTAVHFILCRFTIYSPLLAIKLNVNSEITFEQHKSKVCDEKMAVEHT